MRSVDAKAQTFPCVKRDFLVLGNNSARMPFLTPLVTHTGASENQIQVLWVKIQRLITGLQLLLTSCVRCGATQYASAPSS